MEGLLSAAAFDGDWDTYCTLRDKLCRTPHLFHDKIMNAFNLAIQHHNNDIAEDILSELNEINRLDHYGIRREGLLAAARAIDGVNLILADYILVINMPVHMLGTPLESACERGNVELVDQILKNLMESKPGALAEYEKFIVRRGTEQKHSPSSHVDNDRAFFLNEPMRICINAANWELCGVLLPSYIECVAYGRAHGAQVIREIEKVQSDAFYFIAPETCYKMLALPMPKSLKKLLLNHIDIEIPPDSTISIREEDLKAHRAVLVHWSGHCDADLEGNEEDGYRIDLADVVEPGTMRDVLGVMYGLPFGEHRGEDWDVVLSHFHNACYHLDISDIDDHTYWVLLSSSIGEDAEEPLPDDDVPTDEDYDDLALMTDDDSDTHTMLPLHDAQDTQGHRGRKLLIDSDSDVTMETAHE